MMKANHTGITHSTQPTSATLDPTIPMHRLTRASSTCFMTCLTSWLLLNDMSLCRADEPRTVRLTDKAEMIFASAEKGQELIGAHDGFIRRLEPLEIQLRVGSAKPVTKDDYVKSLQAEVLPWKPDDIAMVETATKTIREKMQDYRLPFPEQIHLIRVSAKVEGNAPHCRGASIVLPDSFFTDQNEIPQRLTHELFHILSSHNPKLRDQLYKIIHFEPTGEIALPHALQAQRITNPDAPNNEHVIRLTIGGKKVPAIPVILTKSKEFRPGGVFNNLDFKLMVLDEQDGKFNAKLDNGRPQLLSPREAPDYLQQIGRNTGYIIHPEEVLADNFSLMILGTDRIPDAWIINELKAALKQ